ncbi:MAG TPA: hypothetical protein VJK48_00815 [Chlamydiales bacterium]|nr:MAG: hypothetical protein A3F67_11645 [Verrucomicrobia bacterium RIFCSPHIGHO2_12_FULL_41_10]HLB52235.1 hypothetical protein [Chlamydiales bacterium]
MSVSAVCLSEDRYERVVLVSKYCSKSLSAALERAFQFNTEEWKPAWNSGVFKEDHTMQARLMKIPDNCWDGTDVAIDLTGVISFPQGIPGYTFEQQIAVAQAISEVLEGMESIFGHSMKNMTHKMVLGVHSYCIESIASGQWHKDAMKGAVVPLTAICYFDHENINSSISLRSCKDEKLVYSSQTEDLALAFNNQSLEHRAHDFSQLFI